MTTTTSQGSRATSLGYRLFDADNHYYETEDAFLRHVDPRIKHQAPRWVQMAESGEKRLVFGDRMNRHLGADHTFAKVGRAGGLSQGKAAVEKQFRSNLEPIRPEYRERSARLAVMDEQGLEATMMFPTFGASVEQLLSDDLDATYCNLHAFNQWLDEDWGFDHQGRIYGVPLLSLLDPFLAVDELEFVLSRGARVVHLRPGPVAGHSPADRLYDRFWSAVQSAGIAVVFHTADGPYRQELGQIWGWGNTNIPARNIPPIQRVIAGHGRHIHDTLASLVYGKLFERFPRLRIGTVELGSSWVPLLLQNFEQAGAGELAQPPIDTFREHVWIAPFDNEDLAWLRNAIGADRIMFGSDFPHTDGLAEPASFLDALDGFSPDEVRTIMRDSARAFLGLA